MRAVDLVINERLTSEVPLVKEVSQYIISAGGKRLRPQISLLVAGMFGNVLNLRHLAQLLGGDRPFYGLQARGLLGDQAPHQTLPEAAADYIAEMRQVQPQGPYMLGGFSGGGLTAWEMARHLAEAGEAVSVLVLLDTPLPMRPGLSRADKAAIKWAELRAEGPGYLVAWAKTRWAWEVQKRQPKSDATGPAQFHNAAIEAAFRHAIGVYDLKAWEDGKVVLYRPPLDRHWKVTGGNWVSSHREYVFHDNLWAPYAPRLDVVEVPGDHDSMVLEPNVRVLAARMKAAPPAPGLGRESAQMPDGGDGSDFFTQLAAHWKSHYAGWTAWLLTPDLKLPGRMRFKESRRVPLWNGPIECRLFRFDLQARQPRTPDPA